MKDPFDLERFVRAQAGTYQAALGELRSGRKRGHWMWFVFPQIGGLGLSEMSRFYALTSLEEARAYLGHPLLGPRLTACIEALLGCGRVSAIEILGPVDAMKLRSSMTLFSRAAPDLEIFDRALAVFFDGSPDPATLERLA